jgi:hypothetical protein
MADGSCDSVVPDNVPLDEVRSISTSMSSSKSSTHSSFEKDLRFDASLNGMFCDVPGIWNSVRELDSIALPMSDRACCRRD